MEEIGEILQIFINDVKREFGDSLKKIILYK